MPKLKYVGHAPRMTLLLPVGTKKKNVARKVLDLSPGEEFELSDEEAKKLLDLDKRKITKPVQRAVKERIDQNTVREVIKKVHVTEATDEQMNYELVGAKKAEEPKEDTTKKKATAKKAK